MLASLGSSTMGAAGSVLSRALDAELCRSGGAVQVVGVERGERRGLENHTITAWGASHGVP